MYRYLGLFLTLFVGTASAAEPVTVYSFTRAESDTAIKKVYDGIGFSAWVHNRAPTPLDQQNVIRQNRDTLYSTVILDLSVPATVTLPEADGRYMSLQVVSQDHYSFAVSEPGEYELTHDDVGSRYAYLIVRTFVDAENPADIEAANKLQDALAVKSGGTGPLDTPDWDQDQLLIARQALNRLAALGTDTARAFGRKEAVDPIEHLVLAAAGWGGLPQKNAYYQIRSVSKNDGTFHALTVKDVPVDAFWSVTVYNTDGYIDENPLGAYSFNGVTATPNEDGSITLHFGGCDDGRVNCLPISAGWGYAARMYEPRPEILNGSWIFPSPELVN